MSSATEKGPGQGVLSYASQPRLLGRPSLAIGLITLSAASFVVAGLLYYQHTQTPHELYKTATRYREQGNVVEAAKRFYQLAHRADIQRETKAACLYQAAQCLCTANRSNDAYKVFKELTWDYPTSRYARFRHHRLSSDDDE